MKRTGGREAVAAAQQASSGRARRGVVVRQAWLDRMALAFTAGYLAIVTWLLLAPVGSMPQVSGGDKLHHLLAFAVMVFPGVLARPAAGLKILAAAVAYGAIMECVQPHFGRAAEWLDLAADAAGALCGYLAARWLRGHMTVTGPRGSVAMDT